MSGDLEVRGHGRLLPLLRPRWLTLRDGTLTYASWGRRTRTIDVVAILSVAYRLVPGLPHGGSAYLFLDREGRCVLRLDPMFWDDQDLLRLGRAIDVEIDRPPRRGTRATAAEWRRRHPGAFTWVEAHMLLFTLLLLVGVACVSAAVSG